MVAAWDQTRRVPLTQIDFRNAQLSWSFIPTQT